MTWIWSCSGCPETICFRSDRDCNRETLKRQAVCWSGYDNLPENLIPLNAAFRIQLPVFSGNECRDIVSACSNLVDGYAGIFCLGIKCEAAAGEQE